MPAAITQPAHCQITSRSPQAFAHAHRSGCTLYGPCIPWRWVSLKVSLKVDAHPSQYSPECFTQEQDTEAKSLAHHDHKISCDQGRSPLPPGPRTVPLIAADRAITVS
eukprot:TRINITY_DN95782_c0_g1_i1.p1 TRINITY_DN95782_c0_g1~~TRINITY_DN95782_c0_g1_i1.p1  ORF type:complete len:108 (-),score=5.75 TRINITY_DN95782_c0_g1_i1:13-336(-)